VNSRALTRSRVPLVSKPPPSVTLRHRRSTFATAFQHFNTLVFRCSNVSPVNCGSSLTVILYRETNIVKTTIASVSPNLEIFRQKPMYAQRRLSRVTCHMGNPIMSPVRVNVIVSFRFLFFNFPLIIFACPPSGIETKLLTRGLQSIVVLGILDSFCPRNVGICNECMVPELESSSGTAHSLQQQDN
jgi:hypothetical protein